MLDKILNASQKQTTKDLHPHETDGFSDHFQQEENMSRSILLRIC